jgi:alpha-beta hydrolase superfamily lysophospholipase
MTKRQDETSTFKSWDGTELFYRSWHPENKSNKAVIYLHRGHEHSGRLSELVEGIGLPDFQAFAYDARGHGKSPGPRGYADSFSCLVKDLDSFVHFVSQTHGIPIENMAVVANSVGAVVASTWVHDYAPPIRGVVLAAPALRIKLYIPFAIPMLRLLVRIKPVSFIKSYVKSKFLTHDTEQSAKYDADTLITRDIAVNILLGLYDTSTRIIDDAAAIFTPTLVLSAGSDWVVKNTAQKKFFNSLSSDFKEYVEYPGFFHAVLYEKERQKAFDKAREFIEKCFEMEPDRSFLLRSHKEGFSKTEYDYLTAGPGPLKRIWFNFVKLSMKTLGLLSSGIRLGLQTGFDSGKTLDYVYENNVKGKTFIGRIIDKNYLNAIGWVGIRKRKVHLQQSLQNAIDNVEVDGNKAHIMDIASGPGRYILEMVKKQEPNEITALLRDYKEENIVAAKALSEKMGLDRVSIELGDAFDKESLAKVSPSPNIAVISGLFELIPDNDMVQQSLKGVAECIQPGGYLVYTGQPWHPQIEAIAWTLPNREGDPWIMRRRCQAELDELVATAGFKKVDMKIDDYGIFTVSMAVKE